MLIELLYLGFVHDNYYSLLAILLHTGRHNVTDGVMVRGTYYPVPVYPFIQFSQLVWVTRAMIINLTKF